MSNVRMLNRCIFLGIVLVFAAVPVSGRQILTEHEQSGYENYTSYENMMKFLLDIKAASTEMQLGIVGKALLGREIPYAVFSRPAISKPWEALVSGKPVVVLAANIHGNERTLRESNMILIRELATKGTEMNKLLDDLVILMVPSINPDGFNAQPRATRGNALGVDLNRDYMKLEQPALVAYVQNIWHAWHPHIFVDGHNGGSYPYNINYHGPCVASADRRLELLCDREIYPFITKKMEENGYKAWYYSGGDREQWRVGSFDPRSGKNYAPFVNCISILFESPGGQDMETAAKSGLVAYKAILQYVSQNADKVKMHVERARRETIEMGKSAAGDVVVQMKHVAEDYKVSYEIAEGRGEDRRIIKVTGAEIIKKPVATKTRPRPYAYNLEDRAVEAIELLKRHNITVEVLQKDA
ncbi:hypothetical protein AMJ80_06610, partial [bacterium SM23_31]